MRSSIVSWTQEHWSRMDFEWEGTNLVLIDPDLHKLFTNSATVNQALRNYVRQRKETETQSLKSDLAK
jgi:hypothetical protein